MPRHPTSKNGCAAIENGCANEMLFLVDISTKNKIFVVRKWMPRHPTSKNGCAAIENGCANEMLFLVDISTKNNIFVVRKWMSRRPTSKNGCAAIENGCAARMLFFVDITEGPWGGKLQHFCAGYRSAQQVLYSRPKSWFFIILAGRPFGKSFFFNVSMGKNRFNSYHPFLDFPRGAVAAHPFSIPSKLLFFVYISA